MAQEILFTLYIKQSPKNLARKLLSTSKNMNFLQTMF